MPMTSSAAPTMPSPPGTRRRPGRRTGSTPRSPMPRAGAVRAERGALPADFEATVARLRKLAPDNRPRPLLRRPHRRGPWRQGRRQELLAEAPAADARGQPAAPADGGQDRRVGELNRQSLPNALGKAAPASEYSPMNSPIKAAAPAHHPRRVVSRARDLRARAAPGLCPGMAIPRAGLGSWPIPAITSPPRSPAGASSSSAIARASCAASTISAAIAPGISWTTARAIATCCAANITAGSMTPTGGCAPRRPSARRAWFDKKDYPLLPIKVGDMARAGLRQSRSRGHAAGELPGRSAGADRSLIRWRASPA